MSSYLELSAEKHVIFTVLIINSYNPRMSSYLELSKDFFY